jgi:hypothetical protein
VHVPLSAGGGQGPASNVVELGRIVPEPPRERSAALEPEVRGGVALDSAERGVGFRVDRGHAISPRAGLVE